MLCRCLRPAAVRDRDHEPADVTDVYTDPGVCFDGFKAPPTGRGCREYSMTFMLKTEKGGSGHAPWCAFLCLSEGRSTSSGIPVKPRSLIPRSENRHGRKRRCLKKEDSLCHNCMLGEASFMQALPKGCWIKPSESVLRACRESRESLIGVEIGVAHRSCTSR